MNIFKNLKMGTKLFAILVAPVAVLIVLAVVGVIERNEAAQEAADTERLAELAKVTSDMVNQVQIEAVYSALYLASNGENGQAELAEQRDRTDEAIEAFERELADVQPLYEARLDDRSGDAEDQALTQDLVTVIPSAQARLADLRQHRTSVDARSTNPVAGVDLFASIVSDMVDVNLAIARLEEDPTLARSLRAFTDLSRYKQNMAALAAYGTIVVETGDIYQWSGPRSPWPCGSPRPGADVSDEEQAQRLAAGDVDRLTTAAASDCPLYSALTENREDADRSRDLYTDTAPADLMAVLTNIATLRFDTKTQSLILAGTSEDAAEALGDLTWDEAEWMSDALGEGATFGAVPSLADGEETIIDEVLLTAQEQASSAQRAALLYGVFALGAVLIALTIAILVARATTGPLRKLTGAAYTLSTERLPALVERLRNPEQDTGESLSANLKPIDIDSRDEIGQLADAFNSIQQVTVEVAEEQSQLLRKGIGDIFINLARRNQTLLDRQIEFIDQLESNEEDPDQLDNLFKLDHLATRMRRNAESLLVLAGAEPPRRRGRPVALADVVRVAIGEVEDFARIQILSLDEATVGGNVAVDLAHLLSELMENATHFSPPDTMVEVVGQRADGGYVLSVTDQGIGMGADQLAEANTQLAKPPLVGLALSRSLGFIVIGRLAQRFDVQVKLTASPSGGVTALVSLPADIVTFEGDEEPPASEPVATAVVEDDEPTIVLEDDDAADALIDELFEESSIPEGEEFDRGLQSLVSDDLPEAPVEPEVTGASTEVLTPEAPPEPEPTVVEEPPPAPAPVEAPAPAEAEAQPDAPPITAAGLVKRTPKKRAAEPEPGSMAAMAAAPSSGQSQRSPEEIRKMLSRYRTGLNKARGGTDGESKD
ncbi:MAG: nitrate- and nitrite sensing domain-containing protein [Acidimicrobiia bacterium]|nr:nitrate- and nitrite sensing domain-containing protein [Acidimicrobiia bacterium]